MTTTRSKDRPFRWSTLSANSMYAESCALWLVTERTSHNTCLLYCIQVHWTSCFASIASLNHVHHCPWFVSWFSRDNWCQYLSCACLFNDCVQAVIMYISLLRLSLNRLGIRCALYSLAVCIKMNTLLNIPDLAVLLCQAVEFWRALLKYEITICLQIQILLAFPLLRVDPMAYIAGEMELTRMLMYKRGVNGAFKPEHRFTSSKLGVVFLAAHLTALLLFAHCKWTHPGN